MRTLTLLFLSTSLFAQSVEPEVKIYPFHMDARACVAMAQLTPFAKGCQENVMVIATTTDDNVTSFKITIDFVDENGQDQHREGWTPFNPGGGATYWFTGPMMKNIIIRRITATPQKAAGRQVEYRP